MATSVSSNSSVKKKKPVIVRQVWAKNVDYEFGLIRQAVTQFHCRWITIDTEFPGVIYKPSIEAIRSDQAVDERYRVLKENVDAMKLIQLGLTFSDYNGKLPDFWSENCYIWEINFRGFDVSSDPYAPESVELLRNQGIDIEKHRMEGVDPVYFAKLMCEAGLVGQRTGFLMWITFHGSYDFAYLLKVLTGRRLPENVVEFYNLLRRYFGESFYDVKHMARFCKGLFGGLERIAGTLQVKRVVGKSHCAGSDSFLTWQVFQKFCCYVNEHFMAEVIGILYGLEFVRSPVYLKAIAARHVPGIIYQAMPTPYLVWNPILTPH